MDLILWSSCSPHFFRGLSCHFSQEVFLDYPGWIRSHVLPSVLGMDPCLTDLLPSRDAQGTEQVPGERWPNSLHDEREGQRADWPTVAPGRVREGSRAAQAILGSVGVREGPGSVLRLGIPQSRIGTRRSHPSELTLLGAHLCFSLPAAPDQSHLLPSCSCWLGHLC